MMQLEVPLTLILSPLRAGRGEQESTCFESLFGKLDTVPPKVALSLCETERVRVRARFSCIATDERLRPLNRREAERPWVGQRGACSLSARSVAFSSCDHAGGGGVPALSDGV